MTHIMLDLETRGLKPGCVIASIGAVVFDPKSDYLGPRFSMNIDQDSCLAVGLVLDPETVEYWEDPSRADALAAQLVDPRPLNEVLVAFAEFWRDQDAHRIWAQGSDFDPGILAAAYEAFGIAAPWTREGEKKIHNATRDTRTVYSLAGVSSRHADGLQHVALDDAISQARAVQEAYRRLGLAAVEQRGSPWDYTPLDLLSAVRDANTKSHGRHVDDRQRIALLERLVRGYKQALRELGGAAADEICSLHDALIKVAPHHQGGASPAGHAIARALNVPFPIRIETLPPSGQARHAKVEAIVAEAVRTLISIETEGDGEKPCEGCGKPATVVDVNLLDLCPDCAEGCRIPEGEEA
jgi:hypothetical protein